MSSSNFVKSIIGNKKKPEVSQDQYVNKNEPWKYTIARIMLTGITKNQYHKSIDDVVKEAIPLIIEASKKDPTYLLKAAVFARKANLKGMVKVAIAALSTNASDKFLTDNRNTIVNLLGTFHPGQLIQFVELLKSKQFGKGFGSRPQKWIRSVMENWTNERIEEHTLKYASDLYSLVRLVHPRFTDLLKGKLVDYILSSNSNDGKKHINSEYQQKGQACGSKQMAVEAMKAINDGKHETMMAKLMLEHNVPWDCVKGFHPIKGDVGLAMMTQMGLSALLLNIASLEKNNILDTPDAIHALKLKLNEVKGGRSIPIDFAKPYMHSTNPKVKELLVEAIVDSLSNSMPHIEGRKIGVSIDISGSMAGEPLVTAGLLTVPFLKAKDLWFTTFDTGLYEENTIDNNKTYYRQTYERFTVCPQLKGCTSKDQVTSLLNLKTHGGTDVSISLRKALETNRSLDLHVLITDEQQNTGTPIMKVWKEYKEKVNPRAELWVINATNNEWHSADFNDPSVTVYQTMTPAIFNNLQFLGQDLVSGIENVDLNSN